MDRSEIVYNEKIVSQIKPIPITDFRYETKMGFSFTVAGGRWGHTTGPQIIIEGWRHFPFFGVTVADPPPAI